jgi:phenylacetate-coenzyme A ligase PaaK-like adenylate-forming protein
VTRPPLDRWIAERLGLGPSEALTRPALERWQDHRLAETVRWARRSRFYGPRLAHLTDSEVATRQDLARLPLTSVDDLRADPYAFLCLSQDRVERIVTQRSSGTTAPPKRVLSSREDLAISRLFFQHGLAQMTAPDERVLVLLPGTAADGVTDLLRQAILGLGAHPILAAGLDVPQVATLLADRPVDLVIGHPTQVLALARLTAPPASPCRPPGTVLLCTDRISPVVQKAIFDIWSCEIFAHWGMTELGYGGGVDCARHAGYHLQESDVLVEILDPDDASPCPPGTVGEVVVTTLTRTGMPLLRYRTGDHARLIGVPCACGSPLLRLDAEIRRPATHDGQPGIASLDDVLFALADVLDVGASRTADGGLSIAVRRRPFSGLGERCVREALERIPGFAARPDTGPVTVTVVDGPLLHPAGKRRITPEAPP